MPRLHYVFMASLAALGGVVGISLLCGSARAQTGETAGKELFARRCAGCHALDRDKEGPRLGGALGRAAASVPSFQYSEALQKSGLTWSDDTLDRWLTDPERLVPGNDMGFRLERLEERNAIIAYLKQVSGK